MSTAARHIAPHGTNIYEPKLVCIGCKYVNIKSRLFYFFRFAHGRAVLTHDGSTSGITQGCAFESPRDNRPQLWGQIPQVPHKWELL